MFRLNRGIKGVSGKKEKWDEIKGRREKWRENEKLGCLIGGKNWEKKKRRERKKCGAHKKMNLPKLERKSERKIS